MGCGLHRTRHVYHQSAQTTGSSSLRWCCGAASEGFLGYRFLPGKGWGAPPQSWASRRPFPWRFHGFHWPDEAEARNQHLGKLPLASSCHGAPCRWFNDLLVFLAFQHCSILYHLYSLELTQNRRVSKFIRGGDPSEELWVPNVIVEEGENHEELRQKESSLGLQTLRLCNHQSF